MQRQTLLDALKYIGIISGALSAFLIANPAPELNLAYGVTIASFVLREYLKSLPADKAA